jgi:hypothetical protein
VANGEKCEMVSWLSELSLLPRTRTNLTEVTAVQPQAYCAAQTLAWYDWNSDPRDEGGSSVGGKMMRWRRGSDGIQHLQQKMYIRLHLADRKIFVRFEMERMCY